METEEVSVRMPDRLLEAVDEACETSNYESRSELVSIALEWSAQGEDPDGSESDDPPDVE